MDAPQGASGGLRGAAQQMIATLIDIGQARLELVTVEIEEERLRLARLWIVATCTLFLAFVATVMLSAFVVLLCEPEKRLSAVAALTAVFAAAAALAGWKWRQLATRKPPFLQATLQELRQDANSLHAPGRG